MAKEYLQYTHMDQWAEEWDQRVWVLLVSWEAPALTMDLILSTEVTRQASLSGRALKVERLALFPAMVALEIQDFLISQLLILLWVE